MLAINRKDGERVVLYTADGPIEIAAWRSRDGKTRLGIEAPPSVRILRKELTGSVEDKAEKEQG